MHAASTQRCALALAEPTNDASTQRRDPAAAGAPKRWCPAGANPIVNVMYRNRTGHDLPSFPATIKGYSDQVFPIGVRSGSNINMVSESAADEFGLDVVIDDFGYDDYLDSDQSLPIRQSSIVGLTCFSLIHDNQVDLWFDGFVVCDDVMDSIGVDVMVGAPFMEFNDVSIRPRRRQIMFGDEYVFSYDVGDMHTNTSAHEKPRLRACEYESEYKTSLCDPSETECVHEHDVECSVIESEDSTDRQSPFCTESSCEIETVNVCVGYDVDGRYVTPLIERSFDSPAAEHSPSSPYSEHDVCSPVLATVADLSSGLSVSEIESSPVPSLVHGCGAPTSSGPLTTEPCSVTVVHVIADVPQVTFGIGINSLCVLTDNPDSIASSGKNSSCGPGSSTTLPPSTPVQLLPPDDCDDGAPFPRNQRTTYSALLHRPTSRPSDVCLHQPPPVWTNWPTPDCDRLPPVVECLPHSDVNRSCDCAALPRLASGHMIACDVDDTPQAILADDDVCLRPPSTDVGRHARPTWKSPPWTYGRLPPASFMERGPSPRPHDGAPSAFDHVMATTCVSPAPAHGIAPLGSVGVSDPFGVPWTLPPAPPDVGLTAVPRGHDPPVSPSTPG